MTDFNIDNVYRYLGHGERSDAIDKLIISCYQELAEFASPKHLYCLSDILKEGNHITIGNIKTDSLALFKKLSFCDRAIVFAATLGAEVDRLISKYCVTKISRASVLHACSAAMLEDFCDECFEHIITVYGFDKATLLPRFSPGYEDFELSCQESIIEMLESRRIGIGITDGYVLTPIKSVTAVIGITQNRRTPDCNDPCADCNKTDCDFRSDKT